MSTAAAEPAPSALASPSDPPASVPPPAAAPSRPPPADVMAGAHPPGRRSPKELLAASKEFQAENRVRSWLHFAETWLVFGALMVVLTGALAPIHPLLGSPLVRAPLALLEGLVIVRLFILYHDFMHLSLLRGSSVAKWIMYAYGIYVLTPPVAWRQSHNYHHAHTAKIVGSHVGSYLMVTTDMWKTMSASERRMYKILRHPLTIFFAYFTVFGLGMGISPFRRNPTKNWDSLLAVIVHVVANPLVFYVFGWDVWLFAWFLPLFVGMMAGAYLFYAQHNFPEMVVQPRETWEYTRAAIESSSFMKTGPVLGWLTGDIGYHHVHHLNPGIPFYRLKEAMTGIPELRQPLGTTSLSPRDIAACFRQKLWDAEQGKMVGYPAGT